MAQNRLNLNWQISLREDRAKFIEKYIENLTFKPTPEELTMMGNYILWGKLKETDKDGPSRLKNEGLYIETKNGDWIDDRSVSLEGLLETPGFSESDFSHPTYKKIRHTFSREEARRLAAPEILSALEGLWRRIDSIELLIGYYELAHGKRKTSIRKELLDRFNESERESIEARANDTKQYAYLKLKHELVELRKQQYVYQDSYKQTIFSRPVNNSIYYKVDDPIEFGADIPVLPFSIRYNTPLFKKIFNFERFPEPDDFNEKELKEISEILWNPAAASKDGFDFSNPDHLYKLCGYFKELEEKVKDEELGEDSALVQFLNTARAYVELSKLEPLHRDLLEWKIEKKSNAVIQELIKEKYGHSYQINYISTLYCKTLDSIAETAKFHRIVCENLSFPENFKKCKDCGNSLLLGTRDWVKRARSRDGFSPRCKRCEKIKRESKGGK